MKRVLSIMLTMMLVFSLFTGVITASATEWEATTVLMNSDYSGMQIYVSGVDSNPKTSQSKPIMYLEGYTSAESVNKATIDSAIASGATTDKVYTLIPKATSNAIYIYGHSQVPCNSFYQVKVNVYLEKSSESASESFTATVGSVRTASRASSAGNTSTVTVPVGEWTEVTAVVEIQANSSGDRIAHGFSLKFANGEDFPSKIYLDGNIYAAIVEEVEPSVTLAECFQKDMVLQRNKPIKVWGTSKEAGKTVTVSLGNQTESVATTDSGKWEVEFGAMEAQTGLTLTMSCNDAAKTNETLTGIAIGDVIIAAGQSNMNVSLEGATGSEAILADTQTLSQIRLFDLGEGLSSVPKWIKAETADDFKGHTAVGLATAYNIAKEYNIPVGVVEVCKGGASIKSFLSDETIDARAEYAGFTKASETENNIDNVKVQATGLYNLWFKDIVGLKASAVLWYQGEEDAENAVSANLYSYMLYDFINQTRTAFGDENTPVAVCQLAPYSNENFVNIRQSQLDTAKRMNGVYLVSTADLGPKSSAEGIHPANKLPIAERCAEIIKHHNYKKENVAYSGPEYENMTVDGNKAILTFSNLTGYALVKKYDLLNTTNIRPEDGDRVVSYGSGTRMDFRISGGRSSLAEGESYSITRYTPNEVAEDYPGVSGGSYSSSYIAKVSRNVNKGYIRLGDITSAGDIKKGDKVKVTFRCYPTDMMLDTTATTWTMKVKQQVKAAGKGSEMEISLLANRWNDVEVEFTAAEDNINGLYLNLASDTTRYPATIFFDSIVKTEKIETGLYKGIDNTDETVKGFEVLDAEGNKYDATATIDGNQITVSSESVANPVEVQYCYVPWDEEDNSTLGGNVYNPAGLPMAPFKATLADVSIKSAEQVDNTYQYAVELINKGYNEVPGKIVAVLYDGASLADVKFVNFSFDTINELSETITFTPAGEVTNPSVKIMAWNSMNTLVPYCAAFPVQ